MRCMENALLGSSFSFMLRPPMTTPPNTIRQYHTVHHHPSPGWARPPPRWSPISETGTGQTWRTIGNYPHWETCFAVSGHRCSLRSTLAVPWYCMYSSSYPPDPMLWKKAWCRRSRGRRCATQGGSRVARAGVYFLGIKCCTMSLINILGVGAQDQDTTSSAGAS